MLMKLGSERFEAQLRRDLAPRSCEYLIGMLPYHGNVIHARWSGEAVWAQLSHMVPRGTTVPRESSKANPCPGEILLFIGEESEPELLIPYGACRFASVAGALEGNPVLVIEDRLDRIREIGRDVLLRGAMPFHVEAGS